MEGELPNSEYEAIDECAASFRFIRSQQQRFEGRGLTEAQYHEQVIEAVEAVTGRLDDWQRFYVVAAVSGRGVEWAQTRRGSHYHIMGLPCTICGRS